MDARRAAVSSVRRGWRARWYDVRRSFLDFLAVPGAIVLGFVLLALATYLLDVHRPAAVAPIREFLRRRLISDKAEALLGTLAGGLITITSITFSLLLIAVQQSAASLTAQVLDQFLHRRVNQLYFGAGVGVSLFALTVLATNSTDVTPVIGATVALVLTLGVMIALVLMLYSTLNQMRPVRIIGAIHRLSLAARERQHPLLRRTRRRPEYLDAPVQLAVRAPDLGYVTSIAIDVLDTAIARCVVPVEIEYRVCIGDHVGFDEVIAVLRAADRRTAEALLDPAWQAIRLEDQHDMRLDASYGVDQLATIGWTSISSSKSNPSPGVTSVWHLRDMLMRWSVQGWGDGGTALPVVYRDRLLEQVIDALESLGVAASESLQHQSAAEVLQSLSLGLELLPAEFLPRADRAVRVLLTTLGEHPLTAPLDAAMERLELALIARGVHDTAAALHAARSAMTSQLGTLQSRGTRGTPPSGAAP